MNSEVNEGHMRFNFYLKIYFFFFVQNLIFSNFCMNSSIMNAGIKGFRLVDISFHQNFQKPVLGNWVKCHWQKYIYQD